MIINSYSNMNDTLSRKIEGKVEFYNSSTLLNTFLATDKLQEITVFRTGEKGKFFGFGICQQATVKIVDKLNEVNISKGKTLETSFRANSDGAYVKVCPTFYVKEVARDETTNVITVTAYDSLDIASGHTVSELNLVAPYTIEDVVRAILGLLGLSRYATADGFETIYETGANFSGEETLREVLNAIAEATQTIYYIDHENRLVFKRLIELIAGKDFSDPDLTINKKDYFELTTALPVTISKIVSTTELGDDVYAGDDSGAVQYVRNNPFWENRTDIDTLLSQAIRRVSGKFSVRPGSEDYSTLTITPHTIKWRGNFLTEIGDKIALEAKDGSLATAYILDDSFTYNGGFNQTMSWEYAVDSEKTTSANPITIGEKINQTYARVDKVNKRIDLVVSDVDENKSQLAELKLTTDDIVLRVEKVENQEFEIDLDLTNDTNFIALSNRVGALEISDTQITASISNVETTLRSDIAKGDDLIRDRLDRTDAEVQEQITGINSKISELELTDSSITASVSSVEASLTSKINTDISNLETSLSKDIDDSISDLEGSLKDEIQAGDNAINTELATVKERVGVLEVSNTEIKASVSNVETVLKKDIDDSIGELESALKDEIQAGDEVLNSEIVSVKSDISTLQVESSGINASVKSLESKTTDSINALSNTVSALSKEVNLKMDSEAVTISINKALEEGVNKVQTSSKKYKFDDKGLDISSSDSEISTVVNEDGMRIYKHNQEVLTANNQGVKATDLHARTFLIIGENSRLEDRGRRTACFWIGPAEE